MTVEAIPAPLDYREVELQQLEDRLAGSAVTYLTLPELSANDRELKTLTLLSGAWAESSGQRDPLEEMHGFYCFTARLVLSLAVQLEPELKQQDRCFERIFYANSQLMQPEGRFSRIALADVVDPSLHAGDNSKMWQLVLDGADFRFRSDQ